MFLFLVLSSGAYALEEHGGASGMYMSHLRSMVYAHVEEILASLLRGSLMFLFFVFGYIFRSSGLRSCWLHHQCGT